MQAAPLLCFKCVLIHSQLCLYTSCTLVEQLALLVDCLVRLDTWSNLHVHELYLD